MPHIHEKIDFTAEVFIVWKDRVLLRKHDKYKIWCSVGGHIELDEDPNEAAVREVKEEVGLDITLDRSHMVAEPVSSAEYTELIPPVFLNRHRITETHEHVTLTYFARSSTNEVVNQAEEASEEMRWFSREELADPILTDHIRLYAQVALDRLGRLQ